MIKCDACGERIDDYGPNGLPITRRCACKTKLVWAKLLGAQIYNAPSIKKSEFESFAKDNLFVRSDLTSFYSHLRTFLVRQGEKYRFKVLDDGKVFNIWVGKDSDFPSLQDLVPFDLVVILFGASVYENKAHTAVMQEAVHARMLNGKPVWIHSQLELSEVLKSQSSPEYVDLFKGMIESQFKKLILGKPQTVAQQMQMSATGLALPAGAPKGQRRSQDLAFDVLTATKGTKK